MTLVWSADLTNHSFSWIPTYSGGPLVSYRTSYCLVLSCFDGLTEPADI